MAKFILLLSMVFMAWTVSAFEEWECRSPSGSWSNILVIASSDIEKQSGKIKVAGTEHLTHYQIQGFDRRWNFGDSKESYAFIINPNSYGFYYDFSTADEEGKAGPSQRFECRDAIAARVKDAELQKQTDELFKLWEEQKKKKQ